MRFSISLIGPMFRNGGERGSRSLYPYEYGKLSRLPQNLSGSLSKIMAHPVGIEPTTTRLEVPSPVHWWMHWWLFSDSNRDYSVFKTPSSTCWDKEPLIIKYFFVLQQKILLVKAIEFHTAYIDDYHQYRLQLHYRHQIYVYDMFHCAHE